MKRLAWSALTIITACCLGNCKSQPFSLDPEITTPANSSFQIIEHDSGYAISFSNSQYFLDTRSYNYIKERAEEECQPRFQAFTALFEKPAKDHPPETGPLLKGLLQYIDINKDRRLNGKDILEYGISVRDKGQYLDRLKDKIDDLAETITAEK